MTTTAFGHPEADHVGFMPEGAAARDAGGSMLDEHMRDFMTDGDPE